MIYSTKLKNSKMGDRVKPGVDALMDLARSRLLSPKTAYVNKWCLAVDLEIVSMHEFLMEPIIQGLNLLICKFDSLQMTFIISYKSGSVSDGVLMSRA